MLETKILRVENTERVINNTSEERACFGWTVTNVQVTHSQNTETYSSALDQIGGNQSQTVKTTTINYATMTFQRDKDMRNYQELAALEKKYEAIIARIESSKAEQQRSDNIGCLSMILWPIAVYKMFFNSKSKRLGSEIDELTAQKEQILRQAASLLS